MSNKTSDKNVANVEVIEDFILDLKSFGLNKDTLEVANAVENILAEREQDKKRIKELEADLYSANEIISDLTDSIPKQKVKEGLEDIVDYFDRLNVPDEDIEYIKQVKQELLEGEE